MWDKPGQRQPSARPHQPPRARIPCLLHLPEANYCCQIAARQCRKRNCPIARQGGRNGPGARNHCADGNGLKSSLVETVLAWRPFEYVTTEAVEGKQVTRMMHQFEPGPDGQGTHVTTRLQLRMPLPRFLKRIMVGAMMGRGNPIMEMYASASQLMQQTADSEQPVLPNL